ncbi:hypothetical protein M9H77_34476 [Catharanthus roseus]|uniref:Uncharacterized protein n=1 Tax=Catharanthus roseus TaxID=4058 RepID=A0ACB9ZLB7_CATRO|nr:hypothetical protein M9H77_34476 [Catharanthus roseus]
MNICVASITSLFSIIFFWNHFIVFINGFGNPTAYYIGDVAINCGSHGNSTAVDGRHWFGDTGTRSVISLLQPKGKSASSTADRRRLYVDPIPYMTARISASEFYYTFQVNPGQKFIRLHFYPYFYCGFESSKDFFTVKAGPFTLLKNFSASLAADALGVKYLVKEFCLNIEDNKYLNITFYPSKFTKDRSIYAFVNGIEIISMPTGLYYTTDGDSGPRIVGQNNGYHYIDNSTALEMVQRLNIGGSLISPGEDFGMFRMWGEDANYFLESELELANRVVHQIKYTGISVYAAPLKIYQTYWKRVKDKRGDEMHNFTWKIPVDVGFGYLVRLHFCHFDIETTGGGQREFNVLINNQVAEDKADVIRWSGSVGVPIYRDYMLMVKGDKEAGKSDLLVALRSSDELVIRLLNGLEIFKLSNPDNSLASPNPLKQVSASWSLKIQNLLLPFGKKNAIATGITVLLISLNLTVFKLRQIWEQTCHEEKDTRFASGRSCRLFSLSEIISATQNFSDAFLIGRGGFGNVYKGVLPRSSEIVAVKRLKSNSKQGAHEFWTEIETLSKIRHTHLVSLIGYCNEYREMILVYEYMPHGTLADNLYKLGRNGKDCTPLTWEQRLRICIGAARGLDYLHTGVEFGVIHRDVKDSNILLDENLVAKISDFGLSKLGKISESQVSISTKVKGTHGYLDPDYFMTHKPTRKTDVYAFGVVMLVVLCGRPAIDKIIPWDPQSLLSLFQECVTKEDIDDIIDPSLQGKLSSESLKEFVKSVESCVQPQPKKRPTMSQVVTSLEYALELQERTVYSKSEDAISSQPCNGGIVPQVVINEFSVSPANEESDITTAPLEEGITSKAIQRPELQTRRGDFQLSKTPVWFWPWGAFRRKMRKNSNKILDLLPEDLGHISCFTISEMKRATESFSHNHLIGQGGFGSVYKGTLPNGQDIAVRRLSANSWKEEFIIEIRLLSKLQHRNIVRLLGYCCQGEENILVYEFVPNKSLDLFLFDPEKQPMLDWSRRQKIIDGIARVLLYIHDEYQVIHRDVKATHVLLDANMNPKISDFCLAKLLPVDQSEVESSNIVGTCGYVCPECFVHGRYSVKSDVYSFGILVLEIICGRRNLFYNSNDTARRLLRYAWRKWMEKTPLALLDPAAGDFYDENEVIRYIQVALLCVQRDAEQRPNMASVLQMLLNSSVTLPAPQFFWDPSSSSTTWASVSSKGQPDKQYH